MMNSSGLLAPLFGDEKMADIFSDERFIRLMLDVEVVLARVQAQYGLIPPQAALRISKAAEQLDINFFALQVAMEKAGVPVAELVNQLRAQAGEAEAYVHMGATTQDIMDTARVLQLRDAFDLLSGRLQLLCVNLARMADTHRHTLMVGRTHGQQALPFSFGLKVAHWLAPLIRQQMRLQQLTPRLFVLQFGGASGTLAALGQHGLIVRDALARALQLDVPLATWHAARDTIAETAHWFSLLTGLLAKIAQDIILMSQTEVGEVVESDDISRGGSSTMPQKRNPVMSEAIIAIARSNASLLTTVHQALVQEHERGTHGWQMEWLAVPQMAILTAAALKHALFLSENLGISAERMSANARESNGLIMAEAISQALTPALGAIGAKALVKEAVVIAVQQGRHLVDVVQSQTTVLLDVPRLKDEATYLGPVDELINRVLQAVERE